MGDVNLKYHAVVVFDYRDTSDGGEFVINDTWDTTDNEKVIEYGGWFLGGFRPFSTYYVDFEIIPATYLYDDSTFTTTNYPAP